MKKITTKPTKIILRASLAAFLAAVLVLSGIGIYFAFKKDKGAPKPEVVVNPIAWSVDSWDGKTVSSVGYLDNLANRGEGTKTIDSAESFIYFIERVNNGATFEGTTVYLNKNIDLSGHTINSIGTSEHPFKGTFDGGYYSIMNANIIGNGLFGATDGAEIKNVGMYNCNISSNNTYVGGLIGEAVNTNIDNTYVRLGNITGSNYVGGLVGRYISTNGYHTISNSFADTELSGKKTGGLVGYAETNNSSENRISITTAYYTQGEKAVALVDTANFLKETEVIRPRNKTAFETWDYSAEYTLGSAWTDYKNIANSQTLNFTYPIQSNFTKVFLTGSGYESVVLNEVTGEIENTSTIQEAVDSVEKYGRAEINLIVEKVFVSEEIMLSEDSTIVISNEKETVIERAEGNTDSLIVSTENSKLVLGSEEATEKLILDGKKDQIEAQGKESGALVVAYGENVEMHENVVLQNNANNTIGYGGGLLVVDVQSDEAIEINATITNCSSNGAGGGLCIVGSTGATITGDITGCSTTGNGGAIAILEEIEDAQARALLTDKYGVKNKVMPLRISTTASYTIKSSVTGTITASSSNIGGGAIYCEGTLTIEEGADITGKLITDSYMYGYGGGVYANEVIMTGGIVHFSEVDDSGAGYGYGGGIYAPGAFTMSGGTVASNKASGCGGISCGIFTMSGGEIYNNESTLSPAGGVDCQAIHMTGGEIYSNYADVYGGGVNVNNYNDLDCYINGGSIYDNTALNMGGGGIYYYSNSAKLILGGTAEIYGNHGSQGADIYNSCNLPLLLNKELTQPLYYLSESYGAALDSFCVVQSRTDTYSWTVGAYLHWDSSSTDYWVVTGSTFNQTSNYWENYLQNYTGVAYFTTGGVSDEVVQSTSATFGDLVNRTASRDGYVFEGWTLRSFGESNLTEKPSIVLSTDEIERVSSISLYAVWRKDQNVVYSYSTDVAGSTIKEQEDVVSAYAVVHGVVDRVGVTIRNSVPTQRSGYTFVGWSTNDSIAQTATTPTLVSGSKTYDQADGGIHFYAVYSRTAYLYGYLTMLESSGAAGDTYLNMATNYVGYNGTIDEIDVELIDLSTYPRENYTIVGWSANNITTATTSQPTLLTGSVAVECTDVETSQTMAYAVYSKDLTVNYYGTTSTPVKTDNVVYYCGADVDLETVQYTTASATTRDGYQFRGWIAKGTNLASTTTAPSYINYSAQQTATLSGVSTTVEYEAVWSRTFRTIGYKTSVSDYVYGNDNVYYCSYTQEITTGYINLPPTFPMPTRTGYAFEGWAVSPTSTSVYVGNVLTRTFDDGTKEGVYNQIATFKLYAVWSRSAQITSSAGNGASVTQKCAYDKSISSITCKLPSAPTKAGYTFGGWALTNTGSSIGGAGENYAVTCTGETTTLTVYPIWTYNAAISADKTTITYGSGEKITLSAVNTDSSTAKQWFWYRGTTANFTPSTALNATSTSAQTVSSTTSAGTYYYKLKCIITETGRESWSEAIAVTIEKQVVELVVTIGHWYNMPNELVTDSISVEFAEQAVIGWELDKEYSNFSCEDIEISIADSKGIISLNDDGFGSPYSCRIDNNNVGSTGIKFSAKSAANANYTFTTKTIPVTVTKSIIGTTGLSADPCSVAFDGTAMASANLWDASWAPYQYNTPILNLFKYRVTISDPTIAKVKDGSGNYVASAEGMSIAASWFSDSVEIKGTHPGSTTITWEVYSADENLIQFTNTTATATITVGKADIGTNGSSVALKLDGSTVVANNGTATITYDGITHSINAVVTGIADYTIQYSSNNSTWSTTLPTVSNASTEPYEYYFKIIDNDAVFNTATFHASLQINANTGGTVVATATNTSLYYNAAAQGPTISGVTVNGTALAESAYKINGTTSAKEVGTYQFTVTVVAGNYAGSTSSAVAWSIEYPALTLCNEDGSVYQTVYPKYGTSLMYSDAFGTTEPFENAQVPSKTGYTLWGMCYYLEDGSYSPVLGPDGTETWFGAGYGFTITEPLTLTPRFVANTYTVNFDSDAMGERVSYAKGEFKNTGYYLDWNNSFKVEASFQFSTAPSSSDGITDQYLIFGDYYGGNTSYLYVTLFEKTAGKMTVRVATNNAADGRHIYDITTSTISPNTTYFISFKWDASSKLCITTLYNVNRTELYTHSYKWIDDGKTGDQISDKPLRIGAPNDGFYPDVKAISISNLVVTYPDEIGVLYGESYGALPNPTRDGYDFLGWSWETKNLLNPAKVSTGYEAYNLTIKYNQATNVVNISGTYSGTLASPSFRILEYADYSLSGKNYQITAFDKTGVSANNFYSIYGFRTTTEKNIALILTNLTTGDFVDISFKVMVTDGYVPTKYEPYGGNVNISKNLFNIDNYVDNNQLFDLGDGTYKLMYSLDNKRILTRNYYLPAGTQIRVSADVIEYVGSYENGGLLGYFVCTDGSAAYFGIRNTNNWTHTLTQDTKTLALYLGANDSPGDYVIFKNLQIEVGSKTTAYVPYADDGIVNTPSDHTLVANWQAQTFDINFFDGVSSNQTKSITFNEKISSVLPTDPTRTGYTFVGWAKDGALINENTRHTWAENIQLEAQWKAERVVMELDYGYEFEDIKKDANTGLYDFPQAVTHNTGYVTNWDVDFEIETTIYRSQAGLRQLVFGNQHGSNSLTIEIGRYGNTDGTYSQDRLHLAMVNTATGQTANSYVANEAVPVGVKVDIAFKWIASSKTWKMTAKSHDGAYDYERYSTFAMSGKSEHSLLIGAMDYRTGKTERNPYTPIQSSLLRVVTDYDSPMKNVPINAVREGYELTGWNNSNGEAFSSSKTTIKNIVVDETTIGDNVLTAQWEAQTYTVYASAGNGQLSGNYSQEVKMGENYSSFGIPTRSGYAFVGWQGENLFNPKENFTSAYSTYLDADNDGEIDIVDEYGTIKALTINNHTDSDMIEINGTAPRTEVYAEREITLNLEAGKTYSLRVDHVQEGDGRGTITYIDAEGNWIPVTRNGANDDGKAYAKIEILDAATSNLMFTSVLSNDNPTDDINKTFSSNIQKARLRFTINENVNFNQYRVYISLAESPWAESHESYVQGIGHNIISDEALASTKMTTARTQYLHAVWEAEDYTVTFDANGGELANNTLNVEYEKPYGELPTPTRTGYKFLGWTGQNLANIHTLNGQAGITTEFDGTNDIIHLPQASASTGEIKTTYTLKYFLPHYKLGEIVTLSWDSSTGLKDYIQIYRTTGATSTWYNGEKIALDATYLNGSIAFFGSNTGATEIKNLQVSRGSEAPAKYYRHVQLEQYGANFTSGSMVYATESTEAYTPYNHTLVARWEAEKQVISLDYDNNAEHLRTYTANSDKPNYNTGYRLDFSTDFGFRTKLQYTNSSNVLVYYASGYEGYIRLRILNNKIYLELQNGYSGFFTETLSDTTLPTGQDITIDTIWHDGVLTISATWNNVEQIRRDYTWAYSAAGDCGEVIIGALDYATNYGDVTIKQFALLVEYGNDVGLPTPTKEGYRFDGWDDNGNVVIALSNVKENHELVAQWTPETYSVTFDANNGTVEGSATKVVTQTFGEKYVLPSDPVRAGFKFLGWFDNDAVQVTTDTFVTTADKDRYIHADWEIIPIPVTTNYNTGLDTYYEGVQANTGYTLDWSSSFEISLDFRLDNWTSPWHNVLILSDFTGNHNDGQNWLDIEVVNPADAYNHENEIHIITNNAGSGNQGRHDLYSGGYISSFVTYSLSFRWDEPKKMIYLDVYDENGGHEIDYEYKWIKGKSGNKLGAQPVVIGAQDYTSSIGYFSEIQVGNFKVTQTKYYGDASVKAPANPTRPGYEFKSWNTAETGVITNVDGYELKAEWSENVVEYTVSFNTDTTDVTAPSSIKVRYGNAYGTLPELTREGYVFKGWQDASGNEITETSIVKLAEAHTLTAVWELAKYQVTFDYNDDEAYEGAGKMDYYARGNYRDTGYRFNFNKAFTLMLSFNIPESAGYENYLIDTTISGDLTYMYIYVTNNGKIFTYVYSNGEAIKVECNEIVPKGENVHLTFTWDPELEKPWSISYGDYSSGQQAINANATVSGVTSLAWLGGQSPYAEPIYIGNFSVVEEMEYGSEYVLPTNPTRPGYTFEGWYDEKGNKVTQITMGAQDATLTANWTPVTYTLNFNYDYTLVGYVENPSSIEVTYGQKFANLPAPEIKGFTFSHWELNGAEITNDTIVEILGADPYVWLYYDAKEVKVILDANGGNFVGGGETLEVTMLYSDYYGMAFGGSFPTVENGNYVLNYWSLSKDYNVLQDDMSIWGTSMEQTQPLFFINSTKYDTSITHTIYAVWWGVDAEEIKTEVKFGYDEFAVGTISPYNAPHQPASDMNQYYQWSHSIISGDQFSIITDENGVATIKMKAGAEVGTYVVTVQSTYSTIAPWGTITIMTIETTFTVNVTSGDIQYLANNQTHDYTGEAYGLNIVLINPTTATIKFGTVEGTYNLDELKYTDAGTYTIYYQITADGFVTATGSKTLTINKVAGSIAFDKVNVSVEYDGENHSITATGVGGTVEYSTNNTTWSAEVPQFKNAGTYTIYAKLVGDKNHLDSSSISTKLTITKKALTVTAENKDFKFGETTPTLSYVVEGLVAGDEAEAVVGSVSYVIKKADGTIVELSSTLQPGTYEIHIGAIETDNYVVTTEKGTLTVYNAKLLAPTGLTLNLGVASWVAVESIGGVGVTYEVKLLKNGEVVNTQRTANTTYDFTNKMRESAGTYTFSVQAISSNPEACTNSDAVTCGSTQQTVEVAVNITGTKYTNTITISLFNEEEQQANFTKTIEYGESKTDKFITIVGECDYVKFTAGAVTYEFETEHQLLTISIGGTTVLNPQKIETGKSFEFATQDGIKAATEINIGLTLAHTMTVKVENLDTTDIGNIINVETKNDDTGVVAGAGEKYSVSDKTAVTFTVDMRNNDNYTFVGFNYTQLGNTNPSQSGYNEDSEDASIKLVDQDNGMYTYVVSGGIKVEELEVVVAKKVPLEFNRAKFAEYGVTELKLTSPENFTFSIDMTAQSSSINLYNTTWTIAYTATGIDKDTAQTAFSEIFTNALVEVDESGVVKVTIAASINM